MTEPTVDTTPAAIVAWSREYVGGLLGVPAAQIDPSADFDRLGVDSALAVSLLVEIEVRYGIDLPPEALFDNPTLTAIADHLAAQLRTPA